MKTIRIGLLLLMSAVTAIQFSSCKKDEGKDHCGGCTVEGTVVYLPIGCVGKSNVLGITDDKGNFFYVSSDATSSFHQYKENDKICFDYTTVDPCNFILPQGIMQTPIECIELTCIGKCKVKDTPCYTVAYLPSQCASSHSNVLGLKSPEGRYYKVKEDGTNLFSMYEEGDQVRADFTFTDDCSVCFACHCPAPDKCVILHSIEYCTPRSKCKAPIEMPYYQFNSFEEEETHGVSNLRLENGLLKMTVGFGGCDGDINPDLLLSEPPLGAPFSMLQCKIRFNRTPQFCEAYFQREICFDIQKFLKPGQKSIAVQSNNGWESIPL